MGKKNSQSSRGASAPSRKGASAKGSAVGLVVAVGVACAAGGYFLGKKSETVEQNIAALIGPEKTAAPTTKPVAEPKSADAPRGVKPADKSALARLLKVGEPKSAETRTSVEPKPPAAIPTPPFKPELAKAEAPKADAARSDAAKVDITKPEIQEQQGPLAVALLDREITQSPEDGERVRLSLNFENLAGKPIRAFEGVVRLSDQQNNNIYSSKISVSALISEGGALHWDQHVDARKLDEKGKRLVSEDKDNLKAVFLLKKVFFVDGSVQKFGARG